MPGRVLITRDLALCGALPELLRRSGRVVHGVSVTATEFTTTALPDCSKQEWIAFTSANAVRGLAHLFGTNSLVGLSHLHIATVGKATAAVAAEYLQCEPKLVSTIADGAHLAVLLSDMLPEGTRILYPCACDHDSNFTHICRSYGLVVTDLPVYRTLPKPATQLDAELSALGSFDAVLFYAPSAVRAFGAACRARHGFAAIAIGPTTLFALDEAGFGSLVVADSPNTEALFRAVENGLSLKAESVHA
ncbi:MAG: uroporphyrinogen-III synthase [bacterium]|nr:uroporphyrinogen-III synthase [bacterium]